MAINQSQLFNNVPDEKIYMNTYDLSFDNTFTTEVGRLAVAFCRRTLPGEKWKISFQAFMRTMPLLAPVFGKFDIYAHAFYVPNRVLSNVWQDYIRAGEDGETEFEPDLLKVTNSDGNFDLRNPITADELYSIINTLNGFGNFSGSELVYRPMFYHGSLSDYFNLGSYYHVDEEFESDILLMRPFKYSLLPFKAYQAIWSDYYADANVMEFENLDTIEWRWIPKIHTVHVSADYGNNEIICVDQEGKETPMDFDDGSLIGNLFRLRYRCYAKDYYTSALPEPQRGPDVDIPVDAEISIFNNEISFPTEFAVVNGQPQTNWFVGFDGNTSAGLLNVGHALQQDVSQSSVEFFPHGYIAIRNAQNLRAEITKLSSTITDLRTAIALQEFYESSARYGNRYKEFVYGHFGSMIPDDQLTRPWYLGGCKFPLMIGDVMQTAPGSDGSNVGDMYGKGVSATDGDGFLFERTFSDYGLIMVIVSIRPHNYYMNSIQKEWTIEDRMEEYWRKLQAVGEEPIYTWEVTGNSLMSSDISHLDDVFGYQMRYSYYKYSSDEVHGDFKGDLRYWTIVRDFSRGVTLSPEFLTINPAEFNHIFQYSGLDRDHFLVQSHFNVERETPMDIYSIPRIN